MTIIIMIIINAPSSSRYRSWMKMWWPRRHCTPASRNPSQGLFSFRKKWNRSINEIAIMFILAYCLKLTGLKIWSHIGSLGGMMLPDLSLCKKILNISRPRVQEIRQPLKPPRRLGRFWGDGSTGRQRQCTLRSKPDEPLPHWSNRMTYR